MIVVPQLCSPEIVLGRWLKWSDTTLMTIAVGSIVAEGIGGVVQAGLVKLFG